MKKLLALVAVGLALLFLVACSGQDLDGEYYWINEYRNEPILTIKDGKGVLRSEGTHSVKVNEKLKTFEISGFFDSTVEYEYKDGALTANLTGTEGPYYKKGSKAYKEALEKRKFALKKEKEKKEKSRKKAKQMSTTNEVKEVVTFITDTLYKDRISSSREYILQDSYISYDEDYEIYEIYNVYHVKDNAEGEEYDSVYSVSVKENNEKLDVSNLEEPNLVNTSYEEPDDYFKDTTKIEINSPE